MEVILASFNKGKIREVAAILDPIKVLSLSDFGVEMDFDSLEDGENYLDNALIKARAAAGKVDGIIVADDSGIEVDALEGRPGVHSARYGGSTDGIDIALLEEMRNVPENERGARFVCVTAMRFPGGEEKWFRGECAGRIALEPHGEGGFGYDPVFILSDRGITMAQIAPEEKNEISHRSRAFRAMREYLLSVGG